jgi:hypothetical protein
MTYATYPQDSRGKTDPEDWTVEVIRRVSAEGCAELLTFKVSYQGGAEETLEDVPFEGGYQVSHLKLWLANRDDEVVLFDMKEPNAIEGDSHDMSGQGELPTKYILKQDLRMPSDPIWGTRAGKIIPNGTVFYKCNESAFRPWFHNGPECLALHESDFITE